MTAQVTTSEDSVGAICGAHRHSRFWQHVLEWALILWVVRVPLATTALGLLILGVTPQAQDLFVELARARYERILLFLFLLFFIWALPTHYSARLLLDTDERFQRLADQQNSLGRGVCLRWMERWTPRGLGLLTFAAVLIAIWRSYANLPLLDQREVNSAIGFDLLLLAGLVLATAIAFVVYTIIRPRDACTPGLRQLKNFASLLTPIWRVISPGLPNTPDSEAEAARNLGRLLLVLIFVLFLAILVFGADWAALQFPRGLAVPLILGGWLPFLSYLSGVGRQWRAPLLLGLSALIVVLTVFLGDNHSVRRINAGQTAGTAVETPPLSLDQALTLWMQENGCPNTAANCPRPVIVAASGGASRAGFFSASVIGYFLQGASEHGLDPNDVRRRLFAISSVSGSSVGSVMLTAALAAKKDSADHACIKAPFPLWWGETINNWRDCFEALTSGDFLTPVFIGLAFHDMVRFGWWRDRAALLEDSWDRRYRAVITRADKQDRYPACAGLSCPFLAVRPRSGHWIPLMVLNGVSEAKGGRIITTPLAQYYRPPTPEDCPTSYRRDRGCVLFVETDHFHDLLADPTEPENWKGRLQRRLLADYQNRRTLDDVRLSTAAHNSARFPVISPPGGVRNREHQIIDRIVDGGYFENYGALGALELALAIRAVQPGLFPFVLVISNDPDDLLDPAEETESSVDVQVQDRQQRQQEQRKRADISDSEVLTDIVTPITAFANTRTARGTLSVVQLRSTLRRMMPGCNPLVSHVRVWPQARETSTRSRAVSMSWWLSTPIQRHLHQQTEGTTNENQNGPRLEEAWQALTSRSGCSLSTDATK